MKGSCSSVSGLIERYFDCEVTDEERSHVEMHLQDCPSCQGLLKEMEGLRHLIKAPVDEVAQREDFHRVWEKIERRIEREQRPGWREVIRGWLDAMALTRKRAWIPAAAVIGVILLVTVSPVFKKTPSSSEGSVVEYVESQTCNVMVYDLDKENGTVIWLFEGPDKEEESQS
jgi:anti-sigma factor RsiW